MQIQLGRGDDSTGDVRTEPVQVTRLTIVTIIEAGDWAVELPRPILLHAGAHLWIEGPAVFVRQPTGDLIRHDGDGYWLCR